MRHDLTIQQGRVLDYVAEFKREHGYPPTRAEIARHFGWSSGNAAEEHLRALAKKGALRMVPGISRGLVLL